MNQLNHNLAKEKILIRNSVKISKKNCSEIFRESDKIINYLEKKYPVNIFFHYFFTSRYFGPAAQLLTRFIKILLANLLSKFK